MEEETGYIFISCGADARLRVGGKKAGYKPMTRDLEQVTCSHCKRSAEYREDLSAKTGVIIRHKLSTYQ